MEDHEDDDIQLYRSQIINKLQDIVEIIIQDVMENGHEYVPLSANILAIFKSLKVIDIVFFLRRVLAIHQDERKEQKFERVNIDLLQSGPWMEKVLVVSKIKSPLCFLLPSSFVSHSVVQVVRLHLLLTVKESAINVPMNLEARRRTTFFANSLFMIMPNAPKVRNMLSFRSVIKWLITRLSSFSHFIFHNIFLHVAKCYFVCPVF